jgi:hypothetical protein
LALAWPSAGVVVDLRVPAFEGALGEELEARGVVLGVLQRHDLARAAGERVDHDVHVVEDAGVARAEAVGGRGRGAGGEAREVRLETP